MRRGDHLQFKVLLSEKGYPFSYIPTDKGYMALLPVGTSEKDSREWIKRIPDHITLSRRPNYMSCELCLFLLVSTQSEWLKLSGKGNTF